VVLLGMNRRDRVEVDGTPTDGDRGAPRGIRPHEVADDGVAAAGGNEREAVALAAVDHETSNRAGTAPDVEGQAGPAGPSARIRSVDLDEVCGVVAQARAVRVRL